MNLRPWQDHCINQALSNYSNGYNHFLTLATPGAGKTLMASALASYLLKNKLIDLIICFSPSSIVAQDFAESLETQAGERFDGLMGAKGRSLTYQSLQFLDGQFWQLFESNRIFVIFDEIHHCAGSNLRNANSWGEQILLNIHDRAKFTLALTGTPWRSDTAPIVLSKYIQSDSQIACDYVYGLAEAVRDKVCRVPQIVAVDNVKISVVDTNATQVFTSFSDLLSNSNVSYQQVIENEAVLKFIITASHKKLSKIRLVNPDGAGLIVASSVSHANMISSLMKSWFKEDAVVVTYKESNSSTIIQRFRHSQTRWIISVGMISEGTNIPRLQVCCHLTNIKTEMHFRQILGRILRLTESTNQQAILYMPAEPKLLEYAYRVKEDIPFEADVVKFENMKENEEYDKKLNDLPISFDTPVTQALNKGLNLELSSLEMETFANSSSYEHDTKTKDLVSEIKEHDLSSSYKNLINNFGRFKQETIALGLLEFN
ncbi:MAG: DEAD/DEAH box helicase family protein [Shewanella sp.]|jgi:superfamily II DNA or RNA helicase|uniref:DEAD/DEAH box helicase n=1 Tax=Shewanella sp. TaxID=50422 RepID=UPI0030010700